MPAETTTEMPQMVGEFEHDPDPIKRAIYWLTHASWGDRDNFETLQSLTNELWPLRKAPTDA